MFTRCFEREYFNRLTNKMEYHVINISDYCYNFYINNELSDVGLVEDLDDTIAALLDEGFEEVC